MFIPDVDGVAAVEARGERAYPGVAEVYRRLLLLVRVSDADAYVVDIFRVKGGRVHDWLLHGTADEDMTAECSLPLTPKEGTMLEPGEEWKEPIGESSSFNPYGLIREVRQGKTEGTFTTTVRSTDGQRGTRIHTLSGAAEVFLAKSPRIRQAEGDDRKVYDYWMPQLVVRRGGTAPLTSTFVSVHEPFKREPFIGEVRALPLDPPTNFALALQVSHADLVDTIVSTLEEPPYAERRLANGLTLRGRLAVVRERAGKIIAAWLLDGANVTKGDFALTLKAPRYEGVIESATRKAADAESDAFVTSIPLPAGDALAGQWMIVTHGNGHTHGYEISRVAQREGKTLVILRDDHGLVITGNETEELFFPRRKMPGQNRFLIAGCASFLSQR
jgi:hypothetical protein